MPPNSNPEGPKAGGGFRPKVSKDLESSLRQHHAETASKLAGWLVAILAGSYVLHYGIVLLLIYLKRDDALKSIEDVFHSWLPVIAGLTGGAVTYYFTKEGKN